MTDSSSTRQRIVVAWQAVYADPIRVDAGEAVTVGRSDTEHPGWVWCTDPRGKEGWMPEAFIEGSRDTARAAVEYDARELTVAVDDEVEVRFEHAGWLLCQAADGSQGWIPKASAVAATLLDFCDRWLEAWTGNEPDKLLAFFAPDASYRDPSTGGGLNGHAELAPHFRKLLSRNPSWTWRREELIPTAAGFTLKWHAMIPVGDQVVEEDGLDIVELKGGRISRNEVFFDRTALFAAMR